jgi:hypothetical protein
MFIRREEVIKTRRHAAVFFVWWHLLQAANSFNSGGVVTLESYVLPWFLESLKNHMDSTGSLWSSHSANIDIGSIGGQDGKTYAENWLKTLCCFPMFLETAQRIG